tara:strand:+ start:760 stop:1047 length:288 start_codon:yes stop_codon:yes gene_type:complete
VIGLTLKGRIIDRRVYKTNDTFNTYFETTITQCNGKYKLQINYGYGKHTRHDYPQRWVKGISKTHNDMSSCTQHIENFLSYNQCQKIYQFNRKEC